MSLQITPRTRVGEVLDAYPQLEDVLLAYSPHFEKLRNPILRRTLARVATLQAAAVTAGVDVGELVRHLRTKIGQPDPPGSLDPAPDRVQKRSAPTTSPAWVETKHVAFRLDIDEMLNRDEHPLAMVKKRVASLDNLSIIQLESTFRPEPLIEALLAEGHRVYSWQVIDGIWRTVIARMGNGGKNHVDR